MLRTPRPLAQTSSGFRSLIRSLGGELCGRHISFLSNSLIYAFVLFHTSPCHVMSIVICLVVILNSRLSYVKRLCLSIRHKEEFVIHYLNGDGALENEECSVALSKLLDRFQDLACLSRRTKLEGLDAALIFLDFELNEVRDLIQQWKVKRSGVIKDLESLIGKLAHALQVVRPGKMFLRQMF